VVICLERGAVMHMAQLMSLPLTVSCFSEIQIGFTILVLAHPGSPGKRAVKRVCVRVIQETKGLRKMLRVSWTAKKTNEWVLNKAGVKKELIDTVNARKLAYYGHTMRKQGSCLEKEIMQGTMPGARSR